MRILCRAYAASLAATVTSQAMVHAMLLYLGLFLCVALLLACAPPLKAEKLYGTIEEHSRRLARPRQEPIKTAVATGMARKPLGDLTKVFGKIDAQDFTFNMGPEDGKLAPVSGSKKEDDHSVGKMLAGDAEDQELVIAWEQWHKRVAGAIYQEWERNGEIPGVAQVTLTFTSDGHITLNVDRVLLPGAIMAMLGGVDPDMASTKEDFRRRVEESVYPLEHASVLQFPTGSHRRTVTLHAAFRSGLGEGGNGGGYTWKRGDYEHVHLK